MSIRDINGRRALGGGGGGGDQRRPRGRRDPKTASVDIAALSRDESLVTALGRGDRPHGVDGDPVVDLLYRWRADLDIGVNAIEFSNPGKLRARVEPDPPRKARFLSSAGRRIAVAAAVALIGVGSVGGVAAATDAQPGSTFWPIAQLVNTQRAQSVQAAKQATALMNQAEQSIRVGKVNQASDLLTEAQDLVADVQAVDGAGKLRDRMNDLWSWLSQVRGDQPSGQQSGGTPPSGQPGTGQQPNSTPGNPRPTPSTRPTTPTPSPSNGSPSSPSSPSPGVSSPRGSDSSGARPSS